jgi:hypothetical protein
MTPSVSIYEQFAAMWSSLGPAILSLIGVLVGGFISTGATIVLAIRKERSDAAKEKRQRVAELRKAARLIQYEFTSGSETLASADQAVRGTIDPKRYLQAWWDHKAMLAASLDYPKWTTLAGAAQDIELMAGLPFDPNRAPESVRGVYDVAGERMRSALEILSRLAGE